MNTYRVKHGEHAGQIVYDGHDSYGCASDDTRSTGVEHTAVSFNPSGEPFFTIEKHNLEKLGDRTNGPDRNTVERI